MCGVVSIRKQYTVVDYQGWTRGWFFVVFLMLFRVLLVSALLPLCLCPFHVHFLCPFHVPDIVHPGKRKIDARSDNAKRLVQ